MLFLVDRHSSLLVGICMECIKERYMPVLLSSISLFGKALFYTQFGMASCFAPKRPTDTTDASPAPFGLSFRSSSLPHRQDSAALRRFHPNPRSLPIQPLPVCALPPPLNSTRPPRTLSSCANQSLS